MSPVPSERLVQRREIMQRAFGFIQKSHRIPRDYGSAMARWLVSQLPGSDAGNLGWGIIAVTAQVLPPDPRESSWAQGNEVRSRVLEGRRLSILRASRVGEALLSDGIPAPSPALSSSPVGPDLAAINMSTVYSGFTEQSSSPAPDPAQLRREFAQGLPAMPVDPAGVRRFLADELPGADIVAIDWAVVATGLQQFMREGEAAFGSKPKPRRRAASQQADPAHDGAITSALILASVGDYLRYPDDW